MITLPELEAVAIGIYESDCRAQAGIVAKKTTLSRIRPYHNFPSWEALEPRQRWTWRRRAEKVLNEAADPLRGEAEVW